jgi:3-hydroxyacyl-CoA dehydrogenase/enoyl-CoA hydratase/carnithine racemase
MGQIFACTVTEGIAEVRIDDPGDVVNTWTESAVRDFEQVLLELDNQKNSLKGVIFISGKKGHFHAGANLKMLEVADIETLGVFGRLLNALFMRLENLGIPTIAAIDGQCMGGGYEFSLATTARIATDSKQTLIGLPECNVGVIPGAGGTQRMPRLIGYDAIQMILSGQVVPAKKAFAKGMVDRVVPEGGDLLAEARAFLEEINAGKAELKRDTHDFSKLDDVMAMARDGVLKATRGREIPGPMMALKAMQEGLKVSLQDGLAIEGDCFFQAYQAPERKGMINTFFLKTHSDKPLAMIPKNARIKPLNRFAVLGLGTMGRGIVIEILRCTGKPVVVKDLPEALEPGLAFIHKILSGMAEKGKLKATVDDLMKLVLPVSTFTGDFKDVDCVIEAVFEDLDLKDRVYTELCTAVPEDCIIASNTSSLPVDRLAKCVSNRSRFAGAHFFSPVWMMQLLEVIRGKDTSDDTINTLMALCSQLKKRPIVCRDNPGFVVNAMLRPYFLKSFSLLEEGVSIEQIDKAMMNFGLPVGPIRLIDEVGIDIVSKALSDKMPKSLANVYGAGRFGRNKNGKGFYTKDGSVDPEVLPLINPEGKSKDMDMNELQKVLFTPFVEVGKDLLDRKIVDDPRSIDIGAIWGVGFPADKGGPMKWADLIQLSSSMFGASFY